MKKSTRENAFTLIEIIVTIAILGIVVAAVFSLFNYSLNIFGKGEDRSSIQHSSRLISMYISDEIRTAKEVEILSELPSVLGNYNYIYAQNGSVKHRTADGTQVINVYASTDSNLAINLNFKRGTANKLLKFKVSSSLNNQLFEIDSEVTPLNLEALDTIDITSNSTPVDPNIETNGGSVIRYSNPINDDETIVELDALILDLKTANAFLDVDNSGVLTLRPPTERLNFVTLPLKGNLGSSITWTASDNSYIITSGASIGTVYRPNFDAADASVTLTATLTKGAFTENKVFSLIIKKLEPFVFVTGSNVDLNFEQDVDYEIEVSGGNPDYIFSTSSSLPAGITLEPDGTLVSFGDQFNVSNFPLTLSISVHDMHVGANGVVSHNTISKTITFNHSAP